MHLVRVYFWCNTRWKHFTLWVVTETISVDALVEILKDKNYSVDVTMGFWIQETIRIAHGEVFYDTHIGWIE